MCEQDIKQPGKCRNNLRFRIRGCSRWDVPMTQIVVLLFSNRQMLRKASGKRTYGQIVSSFDIDLALAPGSSSLNLPLPRKRTLGAIPTLGRTSTYNCISTYAGSHPTILTISVIIQQITLDRGFVRVKVMINVAYFFLTLQLFQLLFPFDSFCINLCNKSQASSLPSWIVFVLPRSFPVHFSECFLTFGMT
jgi:hypothetical protein